MSHIVDHRSHKLCLIVAFTGIVYTTNLSKFGFQIYDVENEKFEGTGDFEILTTASAINFIKKKLLTFERVVIPFVTDTDIIKLIKELGGVVIQLGTTEYDTININNGDVEKSILLNIISHYHNYDLDDLRRSYLFNKEPNDVSNNEQQSIINKRLLSVLKFTIIISGLGLATYYICKSINRASNNLNYISNNLNRVSNHLYDISNTIDRRW